MKKLEIGTNNIIVKLAELEYEIRTDWAFTEDEKNAIKEIARQLIRDVN